MLPFLDSQVNFKYKHLILNSYIYYDDNDELFCILYNWSSDPEFLKFEGKLMEHHLYDSHDDYNDKVVYKFRLSRDMVIGKNLFLKGDYKSFSDDHKNSIVSYLTEKKVGNLKNIIEILSVDSDRNSLAPDKELETFLKHVTITESKPEDFKYEGN